MEEETGLVIEWQLLIELPGMKEYACPWCMKPVSVVEGMPSEDAAGTMRWWHVPCQLEARVHERDKALKKAQRAKLGAAEGT